MADIKARGFILWLAVAWPVLITRYSRTNVDICSFHLVSCSEWPARQLANRVSQCPGLKSLCYSPYDLLDIPCSHHNLLAIRLRQCFIPSPLRQPLPSDKYFFKIRPFLFFVTCRTFSVAPRGCRTGYSRVERRYPQPGSAGGQRNTRVKLKIGPNLEVNGSAVEHRPRPMTVGDDGSGTAIEMF